MGQKFGYHQEWWISGPFRYHQEWWVPGPFTSVFVLTPLGCPFCGWGAEQEAS